MKTIVLHSGGLDSTVCLYLAVEQGREAVSVGIDYGQRHKIELTRAAEHCSALGIERVVLPVRWNKPTIRIPRDRSVEQMREGSPAFLPARNVVLLSLGCAEASRLGAGEVWIGVNAVDYSGYPDCRPDFVDAFNKMIELAVPAGPRVVAPLQYMSKQEIGAEAERLGILPDSTWSCYTPVTRKGRPEPCGRCDACRLHSLAR